MSPEKKDQLPEKEESRKSMDDYMNEGWADFVKDETITPAKKVDAKEVKAAPVEEVPCPNCPKDEKGNVKRPFKVLKYMGKDTPVYSEDELIELAQKGYDYTQKTQSLSAKEKELESKADILLKKLDTMGLKPEPAPTTGMSAVDSQAALEPSDAELGKEFGIDPEFADEAQKKMARKISSLERQLKQKDSSMAETNQYVQAFMVEKAVGMVGKMITESRKKYPFEEIVDESGKNISQDYIINALTLKFQSNPKRPVAETVEEVIRDYALTQTRAKASAVPAISNDLPVDKFKEQYPDLYQKVVKETGGKAVAEYVETKSELPPTIEGKTADVKAVAKESKKGFKNVNESIDAAFDDKDIQSMFGG